MATSATVTTTTVSQPKAVSILSGEAIAPTSTASSLEPPARVVPSSAPSAAEAVSQSTAQPHSTNTPAAAGSNTSSPALPPPSNPQLHAEEAKESEGGKSVARVRPFTATSSREEFISVLAAKAKSSQEAARKVSRVKCQSANHQLVGKSSF